MAFFLDYLESDFLSTANNIHFIRLILKKSAQATGWSAFSCSDFLSLGLSFL
jgi:hypothetical protein